MPDHSWIGDVRALLKRAESGELAISREQIIINACYSAMEHVNMAFGPEVFKLAGTGQRDKALSDMRDLMREIKGHTT